MNTEELYAVDLQSLGADVASREYASQYPSLRHAIAACTRADWLAWLLRRVGHPLAPLLESECVRRARMHADAAYDDAAADAAAAAYDYAAADAAAAALAAAYAAYASAALAATYAANAAVYAANANATYANAADDAALAADAASYAAHAATYAADAAAAAEHRYLCDWVRARLNKENNE